MAAPRVPERVVRTPPPSVASSSRMERPQPINRLSAGPSAKPYLTASTPSLRSSRPPVSVLAASGRSQRPAVVAVPPLRSDRPPTLPLVTGGFSQRMGTPPAVPSVPGGRVAARPLAAVQPAERRFRESIQTRLGRMTTVPPMALAATERRRPAPASSVTVSGSRGERPLPLLPPTPANRAAVLPSRPTLPIVRDFAEPTTVDRSNKTYRFPESKVREILREGDL